jgi:hypothetical protein
MVAEFVRRPIDIPNDFALLLWCFEDRLDRVLSEFPKELEGVAVGAKTVEKESRVNAMCKFFSWTAG